MLLYLIILWVRNLNRAQRRYFISVPCGVYRSWSIQDGLFTYMSDASIRVTQMAGGWLKKFNAVIYVWGLVLKLTGFLRSS